MCVYIKVCFENQGVLEYVFFRHDCEIMLLII